MSPSTLRVTCTTDGHSAMAELLLTDEEVVNLTKRHKPTLQARILGKMGIPFQPHPTDPVLLVARDAARAWLMGDDLPEDAPPTPNIAGLRERRRKHGTSQKADR